MAIMPIEDRTVEKTIKVKYREVLKKLHTCRPEDKAGLKQLLNYYYNILQQ